MWYILIFIEHGAADGFPIFAPHLSLVTENIIGERTMTKQGYKYNDMVYYIIIYVYGK